MASTPTTSACIEDIVSIDAENKGSNGSKPNQQRLLGAYYTPGTVAKALASWALASRDTTVLDPSFGGCAFLTAATSILAGKGVNEPGRLVFGIDIDKACLKYVRDRSDLLDKNCVFRDFLACSPHDVRGAPFGAILGNPPFVRHHWLKGAARRAARASVTRSGVHLPETANTWAYFLIHSLQFLAEGWSTRNAGA